LVSAGLFIRVNNVSKIGYPLSAYEVKDSFKIYLFDVGLLKAMMHIDNRAILTKMDFDFNGIIAENFVATQSLVEKFDSVHYFNINQIIDIDFTYQFNMKNVVIEVKSGENIKSKSLSKYHQEHAAEKNIIVRYSLKNYVVQD
jgi:predicted AAA+ superfamily ATPase